MKMKIVVVVLVTLAAAVFFGCGPGNSSQAVPPTTVAGTWTGTLTGSDGVVSTITATFEQSGDNLGGTMGTDSACLPSGTIAGGTVNGSTVSWSDSGVGNLTGKIVSSATATTMSGTWSVNNSLVAGCNGDTGTFTLIEQ